MGQGLVDFALGAAVIVAPSPQVAIAASLLKAGTSVIVSRSQKRSGEANAQAEQQSAEQIALEWERVSCTLRKKDGTSKDLLHNLSGEAQPGRSTLLHQLTCM